MTEIGRKRPRAVRLRAIRSILVGTSCCLCFAVALTLVVVAGSSSSNARSLLQGILILGPALGVLTGLLYAMLYPWLKSRGRVMQGTTLASVFLGVGWLLFIARGIHLADSIEDANSTIATAVAWGSMLLLPVIPSVFFGVIVGLSAQEKIAQSKAAFHEGHSQQQ